MFCHPRPFVFLIIKLSLSTTFHVKLNHAFFKVLLLIVLKNIYINVFGPLISLFFVEYFLGCIGEGWLLHAVTKLGAFFRAASALHTYRIHELTYVLLIPLFSTGSQYMYVDHVFCYVLFLDHLLTHFYCVSS